MQNLLSCITPNKYNDSPDGWNYDVYEFANVIICTGYRKMPGEKLEDFGEFEEMAETIKKKHEWKDARPIIHELLLQLIKRIQ